MNKLIYILSVLLLVAAGCSKEDMQEKAQSVSVEIRQSYFVGKTKAIVDGDNLKSEQQINSVAIFLAEPSSDIITHKFLDVQFTDMGNYQVATLQVDLSELKRKDIYLITNYGDVDMSAVNTLNDIGNLITPVINEEKELNPDNGFCMFGKLYDFDFTNESEGSPIVTVVRVCAKYRITVTFPGNPTLSTDNTFTVTNTAGYAYISDQSGKEIPSSGYFDFKESVTLKPDGSGSYTGIIYMYEAGIAPKIHLYTHMNGSLDSQEFSAELPKPFRNYLYDIDIRVFESRNMQINGE